MSSKFFQRFGVNASTLFVLPNLPIANIKAGVFVLHGAGSMAGHQALNNYIYKHRQSSIYAVGRAGMVLWS